MKATDARDLTTLTAMLSNGITPEYLFFWGHRTAQDGAITKSCLSQWFPSRFEIAGVEYLTAEHFMMAGKARLFGDAEIEEQIIASPTPDIAKKLGRRVKNFDETIWQDRRVELVVQGNYAKFSQNQKLAAFLKATSRRVLVEASPVDRIWGIGLAHDHPDSTNPLKWPGLNLLGFALMEVRSTLT